MFGIKEKSIKDRVKEFDLTTMGDDFQMLKPRYEYTVKIFEEGERGKPITSIQKGIKANSDQDLYAMYAMADQKIQILEKKEINSPQNNQQSQQPMQQPMVPAPQQMVVPVNMQQSQIQMIPQQVQQQMPQKPVEPQVKYFSGGGIDFKLVGDDLYQKQWIRASEDDAKRIRIINDANNKIVELKGKHFELLNWVKVDSTDKALG